MLPNCLTQPAANCGFGFGLGLEGGIGEHVVDGLANARSVVGVVELENIPADVAFEALGHALFEEVPLKPELAFVAAGFVGVIDAVESEVPDLRGAEESVLDGYAIADFPAEALGGLCAGDGAGAILDEVGPLIVGDGEFGENGALIFDVDGELRKEILLFLIDAAEPVVVGDGFYAGDAEHFVAIGERQRLDDRDAVDDDQAVGAGYVCATAEGAFYYGEEGEKEQGYGERADR